MFLPKVLHNSLLPWLAIYRKYEKLKYGKLKLRFLTALTLSHRGKGQREEICSVEPMNMAYLRWYEWIERTVQWQEISKCAQCLAHAVPVKAISLFSRTSWTLVERVYSHWLEGDAQPWNDGLRSFHLLPSCDSPSGISIWLEFPVPTLYEKG